MTEPMNETLQLAEEVFTAKLGEALGDSLCESEIRPITLVVCCAPPLGPAGTAAQNDGAPPELDQTAARVETRLQYQWNDALNPYRSKDVQSIAALHLGLNDEAAEAGQVMSQWIVPGPSKEREVETCLQTRQYDGTMVTKKQLVTRQVNTSVPIALVSEAGYPTTIVINAYLCGLYGDVEDPPVGETDPTQLRSVERGLVEAQRWVRFVSQQIEGASGRAPVTVIYRPGFENTLPSPVPDRMKRKALSELRCRSAGSVSEFCLDEETQLPWLRTLSEQHDFVEGLPLSHGCTLATELKSEFFEGPNKRVPGKALRQATKFGAAVAEERLEQQAEKQETLTEDPQPQETGTQEGGTVDADSGVDSSSFSIQHKAKVAAPLPIRTEVEAGTTYYWCTCGHSKNQPWCDGSHVSANEANGSDFKPMAWTAEEDGEKYFCQCKATKSAPFCDGSHADLDQQEYAAGTEGAVPNDQGPQGESNANHELSEVVRDDQVQESVDNTSEAIQESAPQESKNKEGAQGQKEEKEVPPTPAEMLLQARDAILAIPVDEMLAVHEQAKTEEEASAEAQAVLDATCILLGVEKGFDSFLVLLEKSEETSTQLQNKIQSFAPADCSSSALAKCRALYFIQDDFSVEGVQDEEHWPQLTQKLVKWCLACDEVCE